MATTIAAIIGHLASAGSAAASAAGSAAGAAGSAIGSAASSIGSAVGGALGAGGGEAAAGGAPLASAGAAPSTMLAASAPAYGGGPWATVAPASSEGGLARLLGGFGEFGHAVVNPMTYWNVGQDLATGGSPSIGHFAAYYLQKQLADEIQRRSGPAGQPILNYIGNTLGR